MTLTLNFDFDDAALLFHTGMASSVFRDEDQTGRFSHVGKAKHDSSSMPELSIASPTYDEGSLLWCSSASDALLLTKIHEAAGHETVMLFDNYGEDETQLYAVLTSWDFSENDEVLTEAEVVAELITVGDASESKDEIINGIHEILTKDESVEILGNPEIDDHDDHWHLTFIIRIPGNLLKELASSSAQTLERSIGYGVVSHS